MRSLSVIVFDDSLDDPETVWNAAIKGDFGEGANGGRPYVRSSGEDLLMQGVKTKSFVARYASPSAERLNELILGGEPFVVSHRVATWPIFRELEKRVSSADKLRWFADLAPNRKVSFAGLPEAGAQFTFGKNLREGFSFLQSHLRHYVELIIAGQEDRHPQTLYMQAQDIPESRSLLSEFYSNDLSNGEVPLFWLGSGGQSTALHNDRFQNSLAVLMGRKRVFLFSPSELKNLYVAPLDRRVQGALTSLVEPRLPDFNQFPKLRSALDRMIVADVGAGEIIYIPPLWWHLVETFEVNLSVNLWTDEVEQSLELYELNVLDLMFTDINRESSDVRTALSCLFGNVLRGVETDDHSPFSNQVRAAAVRGASILEHISEPHCRERWITWMEEMANWIVFHCEGDPFPSLGPQEFEDMAARLRSRGDTFAAS